ncbi:MAG TPA: hypothetical protein VLL73_01125 [Desulfurivibrionaceae bacterium]|nr:hypothetical protein [Desulfurivibrionaceae bacterium]
MRPLSLRCHTLLLTMVLAMAAAGCRGQQDAAPVADATPTKCTGCHEYTLDQPHNLGCTTCHGGVEPAKGKAAAHAGLIAEPAHPERMAATCGRCHGELTEHAAKAPHFTLANEVNTVRRAFGAKTVLANLTEIPTHQEITSPLALADDLLRRRCLRCHLYSKGDAYPETTRGTGCAACHLDYQGGKLVSHQFRKHPTDQSCLHCHYGNFAGADYHGRFEHDYSAEFRTPYTSDGGSQRPYGVEFHQLAPDVHARAGMGCIDCHGNREIMGVPHGPTKGLFRVTCEDCHAPKRALPSGLNLHRAGADLVLTTKGEGKKLVVPQLAHPAHKVYGAKVACAVCHAQWSYQDEETHLLRIDSANLAPWSLITVQGSFEVESQLNAELEGTNAPGSAPTMRDAITGVSSPGLWLKGYRLRRWETPRIGKDAAGRLVIQRPLLDLSLSYVDATNQVRFDAVRAQGPAGGFIPYTPHTIGKAGAFFRQRLTQPNPDRTP